MSKLAATILLASVRHGDGLYSEYAVSRLLTLAWRPHASFGEVHSAHIL